MTPVIADSKLDPAAVDAAERLARLDHVCSVCVLGSIARGDAGPSSDIDLLALVDAREHVPGVRSRMPRRVRDRKVQTKVVDEVRLNEILEGRSTFAVHVLREAVILHDEGRRLERLRGTWSPDAPVRADPAMLHQRLEPYDDLDWCQGLYLYCLADCYSVGRAASYVLLSQRGVFEFSPRKALLRVAAEYPELREVARRIARLRPFFLLVERDLREPLPFPYRDCHAEAEAGVAAAHSLVSALEQDAPR
jgi:predicted nucleotidyltransferase